MKNDALVTLTDLFGIATGAAGSPDLRQGTDVLSLIAGNAKPREFLFGYYGDPGTRLFKTMARHEEWKYIFLANGGREQLFNLRKDPHELRNRAASDREVTQGLRRRAAEACDQPGARDALSGRDLKTFPFEARPPARIYQFDRSRGVTGFPKNPASVLSALTSVSQAG